MIGFSDKNYVVVKSGEVDGEIMITKGQPRIPGTGSYHIIHGFPFHLSGTYI
jgi:hypothetical protein